MKISPINGEEIASQLVHTGFEPNEDQALELVRALRSKTDEVVINHARFNMPSTKTYHHYQTVLRYRGQSHPGHGRSRNQAIALTKSLCEAVERLTMRNTLSNEDCLSSATCSITTSGELQYVSPSKVKVPSVGLRSSNGWAVFWLWPRTGDC